ncbi:MAG TPA: hypothetical protein VGL05_19390 [Kribbella sp.]
MPIRDYNPMTVAEFPGVSIQDLIETDAVDVYDAMLSPIQALLQEQRRKLLADEGRAIVELIQKTPGDERGIEVTRTSRMDGDSWRMRSTVTRSEDVPAGTIGYRYDYGTTGD